MSAITFTIDVEDPTELYLREGRYVVMTHRILDLCDTMGRKATFFIVGRTAQSAPHLVKDIADKGHEIAYHSRNHVSLTKESPPRFRRESAEDKHRLEQITGQSVVGFRAPRFSLTPQSLWALDILSELGFLYSSSIMPTDVSLFGFPDAPTSPFLWPNGMIEFPLPVAQLGTYRLPYLGGIYLYTMPFPILKVLLSKAHEDEVLWTYTHPYDFDHSERFTRMPNTPFWINMTLWLARKKAAKKIRRVLDGAAASPLRDRFPRSCEKIRLIQTRLPDEKSL